MPHSNIVVSYLAVRSSRSDMQRYGGSTRPTKGELTYFMQESGGEASLITARVYSVVVVPWTLS